MRRWLAVLTVCNLALVGEAVWGQKPALNNTIGQNAERSWQTALQIWEWAEPGYQESQSATLLASWLESEGFRIRRGVADIPTAFIATAGSGEPVIAVLGEYDALPGLSQRPVAERSSIEGSEYGHACGHHLFGVASASAAIAIANQIKEGRLKGTVRFFGCPAEEGGSGKTFMVRAGVFDGCDAVLHWHPSSINSAGDPTCLARIAVKFRFRGQSAHAAGAPEQGRSALDAVELTNFASQLLREHTPDFTRIHHVITHGGGAPNVVPDFSEVFYYVRHPKPEVVRSLYKRLLLCAEAGALATETKLETRFLGGTVGILPNDTLAKVTLKNLRELNDLSLTEEEIRFATKIQAGLQVPASLDSITLVRNRRGATSKGSTDVGDVSWVVPTTGFTTVCWVPGTPGHSWQAVAAGATSFGRKGMLLAARVLAATAWDLMTDSATLAAAKAELQQRRADSPYHTLLLPDQKPPLNYRKAGRRTPSKP